MYLFKEFFVDFHIIKKYIYPLHQEHGPLTTDTKLLSKQENRGVQCRGIMDKCTLYPRVKSFL